MWSIPQGVCGRQFICISSVVHSKVINFALVGVGLGRLEHEDMNQGQAFVSMLRVNWVKESL